METQEKRRNNVSENFLKNHSLIPHKELQAISDTLKKSEQRGKPVNRYPFNDCINEDKKCVNSDCTNLFCSHLSPFISRSSVNVYDLIKNIEKTDNLKNCPFVNTACYYIIKRKCIYIEKKCAVFVNMDI